MSEQQETYQIKSEFLVRDETTLRALFPATHDLAIKKQLSRLDAHAKEFIDRAPFFCLGTQDASGKADVSPRGDQPGFVQVLDDQTLAIPDRRGNNRLDSLANIISHPQVALLFMIPGFDETLRINGRAQITTDPALLENMAVNNKAPNVAIIVQIEELFLHCAKAFRRSKLWDPSSLQNRSHMPSLVKIILDQTTGAPDDPAEQQKLDDDLENSCKNNLY